ncbi:hypothetical protein NQT69_01770 [Pseudoalteromonas shioyasakiensis]|uniref:hypothetical protein n=1 Tax=Pseudoalteromonas shioyasakiensis TaxID=1190813 RepID=UPI00211828AF|nr:hypothetical protein [Pseudoalteromonas shioyasakiensis]MCQ8876762.1 hypothetical protein [Pseudoalteromonas shioyasakiensis]
MNIIIKSIGLLAAVLTAGQALASYNNLTLKYEVIKEADHFADITIKINDTYLRTDYLLKGEKLTEMTVKWKGQYIIKHNEQRAYLLDYKVTSERTEKALKKMADQVPNITAGQIFEMSIDPINDENEFISYEKVGNNMLVGKHDGDVVHEIEYLELPNKYINKKQYDWLMERTKEDRKFGQGFVAILEQPLSEMMRRLNYQHAVFPVHLKSNEYIINLKSVDANFIEQSELEIAKGILQTDITHSSIQFLNNISKHSTQ